MNNRAHCVRHIEQPSRFVATNRCSDSPQTNMLQSALARKQCPGIHSKPTKGTQPFTPPPMAAVSIPGICTWLSVSDYYRSFVI